MIRSLKLWHELGALRSKSGRACSLGAGERRRWLWAYFERREVTPRWVIALHELDGTIPRKGWGKVEREEFARLMEEILDEMKRAHR